MASIATKLLLEPLKNRKWLVAAPFVVYTEAAGKIEVPLGFQTDLNSIPRVFWSVSPATDFPEAGTVHDYLYAIQFPRDIADRVYAEILTALGVDQIRVAARYMALRLFGGKAYRSHAVEAAA